MFPCTDPRDITVDQPDGDRFITSVEEQGPPIGEKDELVIGGLSKLLHKCKLWLWAVVD